MYRLSTAFRIIVGLVVATATLVLAPANPAMAVATGPTIEVTGHGWGHGRGMSQYGAYGYARDNNWPSAQILDHYYGGTTAGQIPEGTSMNPGAIRIELREERDMALAVGLASGSITVLAADGSPLSSVGDGYVRVDRIEGGFLVQSGSSCQGPWSDIGPLGDSDEPTQLVATTDKVRLLPETAASGASGALHLCEIGGVTWYGGELQAVYSGGRQRAVNVVPLETYLRGVVPREIPASWSTAALEVQSVAARSYVMAGDGRQQPYADTCNTTLCQVYDGLYQAQTPSGPSAVTRVRTDVAITATAGTVRLNGAGRIARTEFSSSSGGYTAGGTFPAVVDAGDSVSANPNHDWSKVADLTALEASFNLGRLTKMEVTSRNGLGEDGGRVKTVKLTFDDGVVFRSGNSIRRSLGLKSDWFSLGTLRRPVNEENLFFLNHSYETFYGRAPDANERAHWLEALETGDRATLTTALVNSEPWSGAEVDNLYQRALGRAPDAAGKAYWIEVLSGDTRLDLVGAQFYGSQEYFNRSGGTNRAFVSRLYEDILGREADATGLDYWVGIITDGRGGYDDVAGYFYYSVESRRTRTVSLFERILGRSSTSNEMTYWADQLQKIDDLDLAVELGSSDEFFVTAQG